MKLVCYCFKVGSHYIAQVTWTRDSSPLPSAGIAGICPCSYLKLYIIQEFKNLCCKKSIYVFQKNQLFCSFWGSDLSILKFHKVKFHGIWNSISNVSQSCNRKISHISLLIVIWLTKGYDENPVWNIYSWLSFLIHLQLCRRRLHFNRLLKNIYELAITSNFHANSLQALSKPTYFSVAFSRLFQIETCPFLKRNRG